MEQEKKDTKLIIIAIVVIAIIGIIGVVAVINNEENVIKKRIIGKWSTTIISKAGVNEKIYIFNPDNTVEMEYRGDKKNGTYEIDTNKKEINVTFKYEYVEKPYIRSYTIYLRYWKSRRPYIS